ncbi:hypothetical protein [uncultured Megasphaera sp.]|uniref:hypothetical protein n=1 Tax=uncultured Megasphaera sp. TaxID=165188 RepID=UPI00265AB622|nr:hypothetical protein [uncultured Megasphaera sp.]
MKSNMAKIWEAVKDVVVGLLACLPLAVGRHLIDRPYVPLQQGLLGFFILFIGMVIFIWSVKR